MKVDTSYLFAFFDIVISRNYAMTFYFTRMFRLLIGYITRFFTIYHFEYFNNSINTFRFKNEIYRLEILLSIFCDSCRRHL